MTARRTPTVRVAVIALLAAAALIAGTGRAGAQSDGDGLDRDDQIVLNGRLDVPRDETVGAAAILNGPATIEGTVRETLFVLNGHVDVSGSIGEDVVVVNGTLVLRSGAHVGGDVVTRRTPRIDPGATVDGQVRSIASRFDVEGFGFASRLLWWIGYSASTLFLGLLLLLLFPAIDVAAARAWRQRGGEVVGFGAAFFFLLPVATILFFVTVVGIPLGIILLLGLALVYTVAYVAGAHLLGRLLVRPPTSRFLAFLAGWAILRVIALVPFLGGFVWLVAALIGLGVLVVAARRTRPPDETPPPPPPPVPAASRA